MMLYLLDMYFAAIYMYIRYENMISTYNIISAGMMNSYISYSLRTFNPPCPPNQSPKPKYFLWYGGLPPTWGELSIGVDVQGVMSGVGWETVLEPYLTV